MEIHCYIDNSKLTRPRMIIEFPPDMHPENINTLAKVAEIAISKKINCMNCDAEECERRLQ